MPIDVRRGYANGLRIKEPVVMHSNPTSTNLALCARAARMAQAARRWLPASEATEVANGVAAVLYIEAWMGTGIELEAVVEATLQYHVKQLGLRCPSLLDVACAMAKAWTEEGPGGDEAPCDRRNK